MQLRVIHLEDNATDAELIRSAILADGFVGDIRCVDSESAFVQAITTTTFDLILADFTLPGFDGMSALALAWKHCPATPFIFVSGTIGEDRAIECLKAGATDYVLKHRLAGLGPSIRRALREAENRNETQRAHEALRKQARLIDLANDSIVVRDLRDRITYWNRGAD
jgi:DNA-binding NtrC family response regulator